MLFSYLCGALTSASCGYIGMMIATYSNTRTAIAAEKGLNAALSVSFTSGSIMVGMKLLIFLVMFELHYILLFIDFVLSNRA